MGALAPFKWPKSDTFVRGGFLSPAGGGGRPPHVYHDFYTSRRSHIVSQFLPVFPPPMIITILQTSRRRDILSHFSVFGIPLIPEREGGGDPSQAPIGLYPQSYGK